MERITYEAQQKKLSTKFNLKLKLKVVDNLKNS